MVKYFCDKCGKELKFGNRYTVSFDFEKPNNLIRSSHRRMNILLCNDCSELIAERLENIISDIVENK